MTTRNNPSELHDDNVIDFMSTVKALAHKEKKQSDNSKSDSKNLHFCYTTAFQDNYDFAKLNTSAGNLSQTTFIIKACADLFSLGTHKDIFYDNRINRSMLGGLDKINMYDVNNRNKIIVRLDSRFKTEAFSDDFKIKNKSTDKTSLAVDLQTFHIIDLFSQYWGNKDKTLIIANIASLYGMLLFLRIHRNLSPYKRWADEKDMFMLWRNLS